MLRRAIKVTAVGLFCATMVVYYSGMPALIVKAETYRVLITDKGFRPNRLRASKDRTVHIDIVNQGSKVHNFILPAFYIFTPNLPVHNSTAVEFTPDKRGLFEFFSDAGGKKESGLSGQIVVK